MSDEVIPTWAAIWRKAARHLSRAGLERLREALLADDARLIQGRTCDLDPQTPLYDVLHGWCGRRGHPVVNACPLGYCGWQGDGLETVGEVEDFFAEVAVRTGAEAGDDFAIRLFTGWWDETPREESRRLLLEEVERSLAERCEVS